MKPKMSAGGRRKRVFLIDQFPVSRLAISEWLNQTPHLTFCGEADSPTRALTVVADSKPDVVVTENLRQQDLGFIQSLHKCHPVDMVYNESERIPRRDLASGEIRADLQPGLCITFR